MHSYSIFSGEPAALTHTYVSYVSVSTAGSQEKNRITVHFGISCDFSNGWYAVYP